MLLETSTSARIQPHLKADFLVHFGQKDCASQWRQFYIQRTRITTLPHGTCSYIFLGERAVSGHEYGRLSVDSVDRIGQAKTTGASEFVRFAVV